MEERYDQRPGSQTRQANYASHDDPVEWHDGSILNVRKMLDSVENCCKKLFMFTFETVNEFWENYFGVLNLSDRNLSYSEMSVLGRGLKFCLTPTMLDHGLLKESLDKFICNCSLKLFFSEVDEIAPPEEHDMFTHKDMRLKSTFNPPLPSNLEHIYYLILEEVLMFKAIPMRERPLNLSTQQRESLNRLADDELIIIKKADKGSNIVVENRLDHITECKRQLNDIKFYMKLEEDLTSKYRLKVEQLIIQMYDTKEIDIKTYNYLMSGGNRTSIFYTLPKIHKKFEKIPPGHPIVSSIDSPTEKISQFLDIILQPYAQSGRSYIKDTSDFLLKLENTWIESDEWIFSMDVSSLYTNIPHHEGIKVVSEVIKTHRGPASNTNILKMLNLVLKYNCFRFMDEHFLQINGTAMGTRVAPTYAIIYMNWFEETFVYTYQKCPRIWFRFIDDIWGVFKGSEYEMTQFITYLNNVHPSIKFTVEYSKRKVVFLDVTTKICDNRIISMLYVKLTDNHGYLDYSSSHPSHNKSSIPYSQFLRLKRNCSAWSDWIKHSPKLSMYLSLRGYLFN